MTALCGNELLCPNRHLKATFRNKRINCRLYIGAASGGAFFFSAKLVLSELQSPDRGFIPTIEVYAPVTQAQKKARRPDTKNGPLEEYFDDRAEQYKSGP